MAEDQIRYDRLTQDALRSVIRTVLTHVYKNGLPGQHHFFIAIDTTADGVSVSKRLKEQYPEEITIVLQYQFWDLAVHDERFEVKLSFNNIPEKLVVPYSAIKSFFDPSVQFGLQFGQPPGPANDARKEPAALIGNAAAESDAVPVAANEPEIAPAAQSFDSAATETPEDSERPAAEIVQLDRFRKK